MDFADLIPSDKPGSSIPQSVLQTVSQIDSIASQIKATVQQAATDADSFDQTERSVREAVRRIGNSAMQLFLQLQGDGDLGETVTTGEGKTLRRSKEPVTTKIRSIFGLHTFRQFTYAAGARKTTQLRPLSARMSLPSRQCSYLLQEFSQMQAVDQSYELAMSNLGEILRGMRWCRFLGQVKALNCWSRRLTAKGCR